MYDNPQIHVGVGLTLRDADRHRSTGLLVHGARPRVYEVRDLTATAPLRARRGFARRRATRVPSRRRVELDHETWYTVP